MLSWYLWESRFLALKRWFPNAGPASEREEAGERVIALEDLAPVRVVRAYLRGREKSPPGSWAEPLPSASVSGARAGGEKAPPAPVTLPKKD